MVNPSVFTTHTDSVHRQNEDGAQKQQMRCHAKNAAQIETNMFLPQM